jgi:hypothetical protein
VKLGQLPSSVSVFTADEVDGVLAMLCEHAPQGLDSGFEDQGVDSLRYVLERSPTECAEALRTSPHRPTPTSPSPDY